MSSRPLLVASLVATLASCARCGTEPVAVPPAVATSSLPDGYLGQPYAQTLHATGGTAPLRWSTSAPLPPGLSLAADGALSGTPGNPGRTPFEVRVVDAEGLEASALLSLTVFEPPALTTTSLPDAYAGEAYARTLLTTGGEAPLQFQVTDGALPANVALSPKGALGGTPTLPGTASFTVTVTDANGVSTARAFTLDTLALPAVTTTALADGYLNTAYSATLSATGGRPPLLFSPTTLPDGLAVSSAGAVTGTPTVEGAHAFSIAVTDANGVSSVAAVVALDVHALPAVTTTMLPDAYQGEAYTQTIGATGGRPPYTFSPGALPSGLFLASDGALSGTPSVAGDATVQVVVRDANDRASEEAAIPLPVLTPPSITTTTIPAGSVGTALTLDFTASGGRAPYTWERLSGSFATGLSLEAATLSGTPTAAGTFQVTVRVTDANGRTASRTFDHLVGDAPRYGEVYAIAGWNIEWFGSTTLGPTDEALQRQNAAAVITDAGFAIWGVAEIADTTAFTALLTDLPQYRGFVVRQLPGGTASYDPGEQQLGVIYDPARVTVRDAGLILTQYGSGGEQDYFAGRPPLRVDFTADGGGGELSVIVLHMKANTGSTAAQEASYWRRMDAGTRLKEYLDTEMPSDRVLVVGDWNDDVDVSIWNSSYDTPYRQLIDDTAHYRFVTDVLTDAGLRSTAGYPNVIDHHLSTDELLASWVQPSEIVRPDLWTTPVAGYANTTSDHYRVVSRYVLGGALAPDGGTPDGGSPEPSGAVFLNEIRYDEPGSTATGLEFIELRNADLVALDLGGWTLSDVAGTRHTFAAGTQLAPGEVIVVFGNASSIPAGTPNAIGASTSALGLTNSGDTVTLRDAVGTTIDSYTWSSTPGDGISVNRSPDGDLAGTWSSHTALNAGLVASPGTRASGAAW